MPNLTLVFAMHHGHGAAKDAEQAVSWYRRAAEAGDSRCSVQLGHVATQAVTGLPRMQSRQCRGTAVQLRRVTADAQCNLGVCYSNGDGVAKDAEQAVSWYRRAAEAGHADAQFNLGVCYSDGDGVAKDAEQAVSWYRRAAEAGNADAQFNLGVCYSNGDGVAKDAEQAVSWYRRAAEAGNADAQFNLGCLLLQG